MEKGTVGLLIGPPEPTMGLKGGHVFPISLDCHLPLASLLGQEGQGFRTAMKVLDNGRIEVAAMCLGIAGAALDAAKTYAAERQIGGTPLNDFQGLSWMLADMDTDLAAARALTLEAARCRAMGTGQARAAAQAKLFASEMAARVTDKALQLHGGYGYSTQLPLERYVRDVRIMRIYEGSSEIQRNIIAAYLMAARKDG